MTADAGSGTVEAGAEAHERTAGAAVGAGRPPGADRGPPATADRPHAVTDEGRWDEIVRARAAPHLLQSWQWGAFKAGWGWRPTRLAWGGADHETAAAQVLVRTVGRLPLRVGYVPKGPLVDDPVDANGWAPVLDGLERFARRERLALLKIDADVPAEAADVAAAWRSRGWRPSPEQIQFANTLHTDLTVGEEALLANMKSKTRYNVRLAGRRGVTVRHAGAEAIADFYRLYRRTGQRGGFAVRTEAYYRDIITRWLARDRTTLILAEREGRLLAVVVPVAFGPTAWYIYGASADEGREHMPTYLAQWESMRWALARGCTRYDWWGGPDQLDEDDPLWGVYRFKAGFGAEWVPQLGAWDYPASPVRFMVYDALRRVRAGWLEWRRAR